MARDRSSGWAYAKRSGHAFEDEFASAIVHPGEISDAWIRHAVTAALDPVIRRADGGYGRSAVPSILGGTTTPKADVLVELGSGADVAISVKKPDSKGGQAHLTTFDRFEKAVSLRGFSLPDQANWVLRAFCGETGRMTIDEFAPGFRPAPSLIRGKGAEGYQNRLYASTLRDYYHADWRSLEDWLNTNLGRLTRLVFSQGHARDPEGHASVLYIGSINRFLSIDAIVLAAGRREVWLREVGRYAGSTIQLPWGFLQVHRPGRHAGPFQLQFHHDDRLLAALVDPAPPLV